jgi:uncharacterized protein (DUF1015 family)
MPAFYPVVATRYSEGLDLSLVTAPPYDVISPEERERLEGLHPQNLVRLTLGADLPGDDENTNKYTRAAGHLGDWLASGVLEREGAAGFYLYRMDYQLGGEHRSTAGIIGSLTLEPFGKGIHPHEKTMPGPKADRLHLMRATQANLEPLWFIAAGHFHAIGTATETLSVTPPLAELGDPAGVRHRLWRIPSEMAPEITAEAESTSLVIADGHHRYETALAYAQERRAADGPGPWDETLAFIVDTVEYPPSLLPYQHDLAHLAAAVAEGSEELTSGPVSIETVISTATAGEVMPPKTTLFWPKPRSGVIIREMKQF